MPKLAIFDWENTLSDTRQAWPDHALAQTALASADEPHAGCGTGPSFFYPGILMQLRHLQQHGYTLAVATGKSTLGLAQCLRHPSLHGLFACTRTAEQTAPKPAPQMLCEILLELHISPRHSVMIGDSPDDIRMARAAGCRAIAAHWHAPRSAWPDYAADLNVTDIHALANAVHSVLGA